MIQPTIPLLPKRTNQAFTLVEMMFVLVIFGIIGIALASLMTDSARSMLWSVNKSLITNDFRNFTGRISQDTLNASHAYLYPGFDEDSNGFSDRRQVGLSGDCLVLVFTEPLPEINSQRFFQKIVVYFRQVSNTQDRPVFRTELVFDPPTIPTTTTIEELLAAQRNNFAAPQQVLELSRGLSEGQLFFRVTDEAFLINGEIIHGQNTQRVTNTYNLTISTRG